MYTMPTSVKELFSGECFLEIFEGSSFVMDKKKPEIKEFFYYELLFFYKWTRYFLGDKIFPRYDHEPLMGQ